MEDIVELIKDVDKYDPTKVSDEVLLDDHRITHMWWGLIKQGSEFKYTKEQIKELHDGIVKEMTKRGMRHQTDLGDSKYAVVHKGGQDLGETITLEDILSSYEKPIVLKNGFVKLVGGIANHGSSTGDIDLLVILPPETPNSILHPIRFRLGRALDPKFVNRAQYLLDDYYGPFTNHVDLYDLVLVPSPDRIIVEMQRLKDPEAEKQANTSRRENKVLPMRFIIPLKGVKGYREGEEFSIEGVKASFKDEDYPLVVQKKYDGMRLVVMKKGGRITIRTDGGLEVTSRFPKMQKELLRLSGDVTLDCEAEMWKKSDEKFEHLGREEMAGYVNAKTRPDDSAVVFNVFDVMWFWFPTAEGHELRGTIGDLHEQPYEIRLRYLQLLASKYSWQSTIDVPKVPGFNLTPSEVVEKPEQLKGPLMHMRNAKASEGAMIKSSKSAYPLTGLTRTWVKFKRSADVHVMVIERLETKTPEVFNYRVGLLIPAGWKVPETRIKEIKGTKLVDIGKTLNVKQKVEVGSIITITFHSLFHYKNRMEYVMVYEPRFYEVRPEQDIPDNALEVIKTAKEAGIYFEKVIHEAFIEVDGQKTLMDDKVHDFVMQHHYRGKSVHIDMRVKVDDYLVGWTIIDGLEGAIKEDVKTVQDAKALERNWEKHFKITDKPVEEAEWKKKLLIYRKEIEPLEWMDVEGVIEPGEVGATKFEAGVFSIVTKGTVEFGTIKSYFTEMFLKSNKFTDRWVLRQIPNPWKEQEPRAEFVWVFWKPIDQRPYVTTERAKAVKWIPPKDVSSLPKELRDKVPKEYRYWEQENDSQRLKIRDELVQAIKDGKVKKLELTSKETFSYYHQWWKGPVVIRKGPSEERWILSMFNKFLILDQDIKTRNEVTMVVSEPFSIKVGEIEPGTKLNPTKDTPSWIEKVDSGPMMVYQDDDLVEKFRLDGKVLTGYFFGWREGPKDEVWTLNRVEGFPKTPIK